MSESNDVMEQWELEHQEFERCKALVEQRLEPELVCFNRDKALASIAISLKRIADALQPRVATGAAGGIPLWYDHHSPSYGVIGGAGG